MTITGDVSFNGTPLNRSLKSNMGFVLQDDVLFDSLTVHETLYYAARLRLPHDMPMCVPPSYTGNAFINAPGAKHRLPLIIRGAACSWHSKHASAVFSTLECPDRDLKRLSLVHRYEKQERVDGVISALGLEKCRDTLVGGPTRRGVSGGERKRVSVGHELLINPSVIILDEPTSGLDSTTAMSLVLTLRSLARDGRAIITTIHQPSSRLFHQLDRLMLMSDGHAIYSGLAKACLISKEQPRAIVALCVC